MDAATRQKPGLVEHANASIAEAWFQSVGGYHRRHSRFI